MEPREILTRTHCPYTGEILADETCSFDHVIPEAIGGGRGFGVKTSTTANSRLGSDVDAPFVSHPKVLEYRIRHDLRGKSGKEPEAVYEMPMEAFGRPVRVEVRANRRGLNPRILPHVADDGTMRHVIGSRDDAARIAGNIGRKLEASGSRASVVPLGDLELRVPTTHVATANGTILHRFMAKVILGSGWFLWGDMFAQAADVVGLRKVLWGESGGAAIDVTVPEPPATQMGASISRAGSHVVAFAQQPEGLVVAVSVFDYFMADYTVTPDATKLPIADGFGAVVVIEYRGKSAKTHGLQEFWRDPEASSGMKEDEPRTDE